MSLCRIYLICFTVVLTVSILLLIFGGKKKSSGLNRFFSEILKESDNGVIRWSQGRVYLFLSLFFYFFVLGLISVKAVRPQSEIKNDSFELVVSALQWVIALFAGYVFGAKGLRVLDGIIKYRMSNKNGSTEIVQPTSNTNETQVNTDNQKIPDA